MLAEPTAPDPGLVAAIVTSQAERFEYEARNCDQRATIARNTAERYARDSAQQRAEAVAFRAMAEGLRALLPAPAPTDAPPAEEGEEGEA